VSEQVEITPEQIAAYQRRKQAEEEIAMQVCINELIALAHEKGFAIVAVPQIDNGRIVAVWGVQRK